MDEFDKETTKKMPLLKNLMQMASLSFIKSYQKSFSKLPRIASFAGTSNRKDILTDPSGSRRFICIEVEEKINTENIIHSQIYAQLKTELLRGKRYWFDSDEEAEINFHNREFYRQSTEESIFNCCFRAAQPDETYMELSAAEIFLCIKKRYPHALKQASPASFSKVLMCTWYPFTESGAYKFSRKELIDRRRKKVDFVLIGYGQKPNNPMLYYLVPVSKVKRKMSENALRKYQVGIPVCDLSFAD